MRCLSQKREAIRRYGVRRVGLFGSCARGEAGDSSDLDFGVEFEDKSFDAYMDVKVFLERVFASNVDLVLVDAIKPRLKGPILKEAVYAPGL